MLGHRLKDKIFGLGLATRGQGLGIANQGLGLGLTLSGLGLVPCGLVNITASWSGWLSKIR